MRQHVREVQKKGTPAVLADKFNRFLGIERRDLLTRYGVPFIDPVAHDRRAHESLFRPMAKDSLKTLPLGKKRLSETEMPFADQRCGISILLENLRQGDLIRVEADRRIRLERAPVLFLIELRHPDAWWI